MLPALIVLLMLAPTSPTTRPADAELTPYGQPAAVAVEEAIPVADVLADPAAFAGREVTVVGTVVDVCAKAGCWVRLAADADAEVSPTPGMDTAFVKLTCPADGRLVPTDARGRTAYAAGEVVVEEIDEATARHYAQDAGATPEQVAAITGPQKAVRIMTPGVTVAAAG